MSACESLMSPGRGGPKIGSTFRPAAFAIASRRSSRLCRSPHAMLQVSPAGGPARAASRFAETTLSTYVKSREIVAVAVDRRPAALQDGRREPRNDRGILGGGVLSGTEHVEIAQHDRLHAVDGRGYGRSARRRACWRHTGRAGPVAWSRGMAAPPRSRRPMTIQPARLAGRHGGRQRASPRSFRSTLTSFEASASPAIGRPTGWPPHGG